VLRNNKATNLNEQIGKSSTQTLATSHVTFANVTVCMGVKLGLPRQGKDITWQIEGV